MTQRPNFLIILADDLGFSDLGCFGSEINTPNIDQLAADGIRLLNHHTAAACSPTRAMIMTGTDNQLAGVGCMIEFKQNENGVKRWGGKAGHEGYMSQDVACIAEILSDQGYLTAMAGKWHLGMRPTHGPSARGFKRSFCVLPGCCNHFGWEPVLENGMAANPAGGRVLHCVDGKRFHIEPNKTEDPEGFYSSDTYTTALIDYLQGRSDADKEKPFVGYLAFSAPHWPLPAPKTVEGLYKDTYLEGPETLRQRRLAKLIELGIIAPDVVPHNVVPPMVPEWDTFTPEEKFKSSRAMSAYAAMVHQMDVNVGRIIEFLKKSGDYKNTFIILMSDNGAQGAAVEARLRLGPFWAQASTAPSRLMKMFPSEGGILVPAIVRAPKITPPLVPGGFSRALTTCMDLAPTILDMIGVTLPLNEDGSKVLFRGREVTPMRGKSWKGYLEESGHADPMAGEQYAVHRSDEAIGWELHARVALRRGRWKIVHLEKTWGGVGQGDYGWELFDIISDPGETKDLSGEEPGQLKELLALWDQYVVECGIIWGEDAFAPGLSQEEAPWLHDSQFEQQRTWMMTPAGESARID